MDIDKEKKWTAIFQQQGYVKPVKIGSGMEGTVYLLEPDKLVAKIWGDSSEKRLNTLATFYKRLAPYSNNISTAEIIRIEQIDNKFVTFEKFLGGKTLQSKQKQSCNWPNKQAVVATVKVLEFLKSIPFEPPFKQIGVIGSKNSPCENLSNWSEVIAKLLITRSDKYQHLLEQDIENFSRLKRQLCIFLKGRSHVKTGLIHGDLFGENILIDPQFNPTAVLDFGFLSMAGDPAFDAAIASSIFDMYGPDMIQVDSELTDTFAKHFGYKTETLLAYKAVYAVISSNAYSSSRNDGHYQWCINLLKRKDILSAVGIY